MDDLYAILELILLYVVAIIFGDLGTRLIPWVQNQLNSSEERLKINLPRFWECSGRTATSKRPGRFVTTHSKQLELGDS